MRFIDFAYGAQWIFALVAVANLVAAASTSKLPLNQLYQQARQTRILYGPGVAQSSYEHILDLNPSDITTATRLAATKSTASVQRWYNACQLSSAEDFKKLEHLRNWFISVKYSSDSVGTVLNVGRKSRAPIYVKPAHPGSVMRLPFASSALTPCQCLTALFLLGLCVSVSDAKRCCSDRIIELLKDIGLIGHCEYNDDLLYAVVSIVPIDLPGRKKENVESAYIATDWHPRVLNTIKIHENEEAVMYVGPDSLALIEHWIFHPSIPSVKTLLDLCTGNGVQAVVALLAYKCQAAVCVDINPRALRFCYFSAALNGVSQAMTLVQGDLLQETGHVFSKAGVRTIDTEPKSLIPLLQSLHGYGLSQYGMITSNPPFLPVPTVSSPVNRYGLFSVGGSSGEDAIAAILALSKDLLGYNGIAAMVSEFFFRCEGYGVSLSVDVLMRRLKAYWINNDKNSPESSSHKALLLTNEVPIPASLYAERRADSVEEAQIWKQHLDQEKITSCSPGLLFIQKSRQFVGLSEWSHAVVPKTELGSIWTPSNFQGIGFSHDKSREFFGLEPDCSRTV